MIARPEKSTGNIKAHSNGHQRPSSALEVLGTTTATEIDTSTQRGTQRSPTRGIHFHYHCGTIISHGALCEFLQLRRQIFRTNPMPSVSGLGGASTRRSGAVRRAAIGRCQPRRRWSLTDFPLEMAAEFSVRLLVHLLARGRPVMPGDHGPGGFLRAQEPWVESAASGERRSPSLSRRASSSWSSRMMMRQAASIGVPESTSSRARAAMRSW